VDLYNFLRRSQGVEEIESQTLLSDRFFTRGGILLWLRGEWRTGLLRLTRCMTLGKGAA
jgi:hypothetical protein